MNKYINDTLYLLPYLQLRLNFYPLLPLFATLASLLRVYCAPHAFSQFVSIAFLSISLASFYNPLNFRQSLIVL